jgi:hypothetical protein
MPSPCGRAWRQPRRQHRGGADRRVRPRSVSLFDLDARFSVPTRGLRAAARADAVKVGRREARAAIAAASRPRLDGGERAAMLGMVGAERSPSAVIAASAGWARGNAEGGSSAYSRIPPGMDPALTADTVDDGWEHRLAGISHTLVRGHQPARPLSCHRPISGGRGTHQLRLTATESNRPNGGTKVERKALIVSRSRGRKRWRERDRWAS